MVKLKNLFTNKEYYNNKFKIINNQLTQINNYLEVNKENLNSVKEINSKLDSINTELNNNLEVNKESLYSIKEIKSNLDSINTELNHNLEVNKENLDSIKEINDKLVPINKEFNIYVERKTKQFKMDFTFNQVKLFNALNKDWESSIINQIKNFLLPVFIIAIFIISYINDGETGAFSNYNFEDLQVGFLYSELNTSIMGSIISLIFYSFIIVLAMAFLTHFIVFIILRGISRRVNINNNDNCIVSRIISRIINHIIRFIVIISRLVSGKVSGNVFFKMIKCIYRMIRGVLLFIFTPDLCAANYYKERIIQDCRLNQLINPNNIPEETIYTDIKKTSTYQWNQIRILSKFFVENSNWMNIIFTILGVFVAYLISIQQNSTAVNEFLLTLMIMRLLSRGLEITIAFYKDIVSVKSKIFISNNSNSYYFNGFKSTLIRQSGRLSLAIHTLIELTILFAFIYYLYFNIIVDIPTFHEPKLESAVNPPTFFEMILFSASLGLFNISYNAYPNILLAIFHSSQVILSGILILLSIAQYIGADKTLSSEEEIFYSYSELLNKKEEVDEEYKQKIEQLFKDNRNVTLTKDYF